MDATCRFCGKPAEFGAAGDGDAACGACARRAQRRRAVFDVSAIETPSTRDADARPERASDVPTSPPEEMRMRDLLDLAKRTRQALATAPEADSGDGPLSVHEAILLVDSIAPASMEEPPTIEAPPVPAPSSAPLAPRPSAPPPRRRLHAIYSGIGLLVVMAAMVVAKARMGREVASAAAVGPDEVETTAPPGEIPQTPYAGAAPIATSKATTVPTVTTAPTSPKGPPRAAPPRPKPTGAPPADPPEIRATAEPTATPHVELLDAMAAAVAAHSAPPAAPRGAPSPTPPGGAGTPSPSARAATRTSPLRP